MLYFRCCIVLFFSVSTPHLLPALFDRCDTIIVVVMIYFGFYMPVLAVKFIKN